MDPHRKDIFDSPKIVIDLFQLGMLPYCPRASCFGHIKGNYPLFCEHSISEPAADFFAIRVVLRPENARHLCFFERNEYEIQDAKIQNGSAEHWQAPDPHGGTQKTEHHTEIHRVARITERAVRNELAVRFRCREYFRLFLTEKRACVHGKRKARDE